MSDKTVSKLKSVNPYLDGRREWNERYGSCIKQASTWRLVAILTTIVSLFAVGGVVYIGAQSKFVRHSIQAGTMIGLIATPQMSIGHLLFSVGFSLYIVIGLYFEEKLMRSI